MNEKEFRELLDEYTRETGFDFHVVQKRWAFLAARKKSEQENKKLKKLLKRSDKLIKGREMGEYFTNGVEYECGQVRIAIKQILEA